MFGSLLARWHQHHECANWRINLQEARDYRFSQTLAFTHRARIKNQQSNWQAQHLTI
jgi:hypothetical protein